MEVDKQPDCKWNFNETTILTFKERDYCYNKLKNKPNKKPKYVVTTLLLHKHGFTTK